MSRLERNALAALVACGLISLAASPALAQITAPGLVKGINADITGNPFNFAVDPELEGPNFVGSPSSGGTGANIFASALGSPYGIDGLGDQNGNQVLVITQEGPSEFDGAGFTVSVSNGENGDGLGPGINTGFAPDDVETEFSDPTNIVAADPVFNTIGNSSGRLENGNVIRLSTWLQSDPLAPITVEPQIAPILKLEFYRDALGGVADNTGGISNPSFGSRIFDTDQNSVVIADEDQRARIVDIDGDGAWSFGLTTDSLPTPGEWVQVVHTYTVDDTSWDILDSIDVEGVEDVEEIRGVLFLGDFAGTNLGGPGNLLVDNALIEIFADSAAEQASDVMASNPSPVNDEGVAIPGDFDGDGDVDGVDLGVFSFDFANSPQGGPPFAASDFDEDGDVDGVDLGVFSFSFANNPPAASAVPEPSTLLLGGLALAGFAVRRR